MSLNARVWAVGLLLALPSPVVARYVEKLAAGAARGAVEQIEPAVGRVLADVDRRLSTHEDRAGSLVGGVIRQTSSDIAARLEQVDAIMEKRLLQVRLGANDLLSHGLERIDGIARSRIAQLDRGVANRIKQVEGSVLLLLRQVDVILADRIDDLGRAVGQALDRADGLLTARLEQADEIAGRRLGNVDVIATKHRLGLEHTVTRAAWLVALVVFVVLVLRVVFREYLAGTEESARSGRGQVMAPRHRDHPFQGIVITCSTAS